MKKLLILFIILGCIYAPSVLTDSNSIIVNSPNMNVYTGTNTTNVQLNISFQSEGSSCFYSLDEDINQSMLKENITVFSTNIYDVPFGVHSITISCNDTNDNWEYQGYLFNLNYYFENLTNTFNTSDGVTIYYDVMFNSTGNAPMLITGEYWGSSRASNRIFSRWWQQRSKYFIVNVDSRGHGNSGGSKSIGMLECRDFKEAANYVIKAYPQYINSSIIYLGGVSGMGGRTLSCINKYPDFYTAAFDFFGMSNFSSWYYSNPAYQSSMQTVFGGTPNQVPENYASASAVTNAINQLTPLIFLHNKTDIYVDVDESRNYASLLTSLGKSNFKYNETNVTHTANPPEEAAKLEAYYWLLKHNDTISIPKNGNFVISGFLETKEFSIWFDNLNKTGIIIYNISLQTNQTYIIATQNCNGSANITIYNLLSNTNYTLIENGVLVSKLNTNTKGVLSWNQDISPTTKNLNLVINNLNTSLLGDYDNSLSYGVPDIDGMKAILVGREECTTHMDINLDGQCTEVDLWVVMAKIVGCDDNDGDYYYICTNGGNFNGLKDCNDSNLLVNPRAIEMLGNNIDENCDDIIETILSSPSMGGGGSDSVRASSNKHISLLKDKIKKYCKYYIVF
ncbi:prolyl oligopeptidase family serine peptidase [Candidatus Woesearchaeota archaeon]|nr:prolyl oligopeptidase family serine peptidase [Candidatus Woesearchaeota archaeon]